MITAATLSSGTVVMHGRFGRGRVVADQQATVVVRFDHGIEECLRGDLSESEGLEGAVAAARWDAPLAVVARSLALAIRSVNDVWGVFARSRIKLLPHQLWVCRRVLERWPFRWLVADDVGLGKTVEAGLILTPLLSSGKVRRLLILAPASLVDQWQYRMRTMFDIRLARYTSDQDTDRGDFWGTHNQIVASAETLRADHGGRWDRLLEADPWDLVVVDEAHHLNADERGGPTLAFQLAQALETRKRILSMVFFTGTPHRGKNFGFLSLLSLLRPDRFNPKEPIDQQLPLLRETMIRNNKRTVTGMDGKPLFQPVRVSTEGYSYNPAETRFYEMLTEFIVTGRAYASTMQTQQQRTAMFVLVTMQKLASSSVAAVRRAIAGRLARLRAVADARSNPSEDLRRLWAELVRVSEAANAADEDLRSSLEERISELTGDVTLNPDEIPALEELLRAAEAVTTETKIDRIGELIETRFKGKSVLLFTEYKATQALVVSALQARYGDGCAAFINGEGTLFEVRNRAGSLETLRMDRETAAARFNSAEVRFLVSTEAAGEGIDLQESCSSLIHVDLPWNPMRMHQRVGRLSRYGQDHPVDVLVVRNPETVESRIWDCLDEKLRRITEAFRDAMDDPEDMLSAVLGMTSSSAFERIFAEASNVPKESLRSWFDAQSATFGGQDAVALVKRMFGNVSRFDFGSTVKEIPKVDLPDLLPFFKAMLVLNNRRPEEHDGALTFKTPDAWKEADFAIEDRYQGLSFQRGSTRDGIKHVAGVGHRAFDHALNAAAKIDGGLALVDDLPGPLVVFAVRDRVTTSPTGYRKVLFGVQGRKDSWSRLPDWEVLKLLNRLAERPGSLVRVSDAAAASAPSSEALSDHMFACTAWLNSSLSTADLPFQVPEAEPVAVLWPAASKMAAASKTA